MARRYQLKLYDSTYTTLIGTIGDEFVSQGQVTIELSGEESLLFRLRTIDNTYTAFARIVELYNAVDLEIVKAFRIIKKRFKHDGSRYYTEVLCEGLKYDLNKMVYSFSGNIVNQTPTTHITSILTGTGWSVGTITPTSTITIGYDYDTVLGALDKVRQAAIEAGVTYDLGFRTKPYYVDLKLVGNQSSTATIEYKKNLKNLEFEQSIPEATRIFALGGPGTSGTPMTLQNHTHVITGISGGVLTLDSPRVAGGNDDWNGYDVMNVATLVQDAITDTETTTPYDKITVGNPGFFSTGSKVRIQESGGSTDSGVLYVRDKATVDLYGNRDMVFRDETYDDVLNLIGPYASSALSGTYTAGLCEGWTKIGSPTVAENTNAAYVINGSKSQQVTVAAFSTTPSAPAITEQPTLAGEVNGDVDYKIAWVTADGEGPLSAAAGGIFPVNYAVKVEMNQAAPGGLVTAWRIYRTKNGGATYYLITELDVATTTFYDTLNDTQLTVEPPATNTAAGGQGIKRTFTSVVDKEYSAVVYVYVVSGKVRVELADNADATVVFPVVKNDAYASTGVNVKVTFSVQPFIAQSTTSEVRIVAHKGAAEFYVDSAMVVESAYAPNQERFVADNGATQLWYAAFDDLQNKKVAESRYTLEVVDKYEKDSTGSDKFSTGDRITLIDSVLGINTALRIIRKSWNLIEPWKASMEVNTSNKVSTDEYKDRRQRETKLATGLTRQTTRLTDTLRQVIGTDKQPSVEIRTIVS